MATERFDHSALTRLNSISGELSAMNALIVANVDQLPKQPELVDRLILRCDEMLRELHSIRTTANTSERSEAREPSSDGTGIQA